MGRVLVEALAHGLPTLSHDSPVMRTVTGDQGLRADLSRPGALAELLVRVRDLGDDPDARRARHAFAFERFSWQALRPRYVSMLAHCAALPLEAARERRRA
jgi:glycosyltransferase involved in cell wall biosynthesis